MDNQAYLFAIFILNGILIGILFDIFRIFRRTFKTSDIITYIEDILFWIISGITMLYFIFIFNNGEIRLYIFLGIFLGVVLYLLTISKMFIKINVKIINFFKNIISVIIKVLLYPLKTLLKFFIKPFNFIIINLNSLLRKFKSINISKKHIKTEK